MPDLRHTLRRPLLLWMSGPPIDLWTTLRPNASSKVGSARRVHFSFVTSFFDDDG